MPCKIGHAFPLQFNPQGLRSIPTHAAAKQSGDRQRREKGSPIMTAEKGEHERAPNVSDSYPTPLRATLRAPPSKWAIEAFFPAGERSEPRSRTARRAPADRSPRRAAGRAASGVAVPRAFFGTFFRFERKYCPLRGGSPTTRAVVGASFPNRGFSYGKADIHCCKAVDFPRGKQS